MNSILIFFIIISVAFPTVTYIVTDNWISSLVVLLATVLYLFLYAYPKLKKIIKTNKNFHSCYSFINTFITSISVKGSLLSAFDSTRLIMDEEYRVIIDGLSNLNELERLDYLKKYFDFDIYYLFLTIIKIWVEQGGDILTISHYLIDESRNNEDYLIKCEHITRRKLVEFTSLWIFTLFIILMLRFSLNSFYLLITRNLLFQFAIVSLFLLLLLSLHMLIVKISNVEIKGYNHV